MELGNWNHDSRVGVLKTYMSVLSITNFEMCVDVEYHQEFPQTLHITPNLKQIYLNGASREVLEGNSW